MQAARSGGGVRCVHAVAIGGNDSQASALDALLRQCTEARGCAAGSGWVPGAATDSAFLLRDPLRDAWAIKLVLHRVPSASKHVDGGWPALKLPEICDGLANRPAAAILLADASTDDGVRAALLLAAQAKTSSVGLLVAVAVGGNGADPDTEVNGGAASVLAERQARFADKVSPVQPAFFDLRCGPSQELQLGLMLDVLAVRLAWQLWEGGAPGPGGASHAARRAESPRAGPRTTQRLPWRGAGACASAGAREAGVLGPCGGVSPGPIGTASVAAACGKVLLAAAGASDCAPDGRAQRTDHEEVDVPVLETAISVKDLAAGECAPEPAIPAAAAAGAAAAGSPQFEVDLDLGDGRVALIVVRERDDLGEVASRVVRDYRLGAQDQPRIVGYLQSLRGELG